MIDGILILALGFGLGFIHALDADHVMAVSGMVSSRPGLKSSLRFCSRWAMGHATVLLLIGVATYLFGIAIPVSLSHLAENLVGLMLIGIGLLVFWDMCKQKVQFNFHQHKGLPMHGHWHIHQQQESESMHTIPHSHDHRAVMVGMVHGLAGSAPMLAIIPITQLDSVWKSIAYIALFSIGVIIAMLAFGGVMGVMFSKLTRYSHKVVLVIQSLTATGSILFGFVLLRGGVGV